ncbi:MAG: addiction module protein, partial [Candidatus Sulfotelmatobacter sp.]
ALYSAANRRSALLSASSPAVLSSALQHPFWGDASSFSRCEAAFLKTQTKPDPTERPPTNNQAQLKWGPDYLILLRLSWATFRQLQIFFCGNLRIGLSKSYVCAPREEEYDGRFSRRSRFRTSALPAHLRTMLARIADHPVAQRSAQLRRADAGFAWWEATQTDREEKDNPKNPEEFLVLVSGQTYACLNRETALSYRHMSDLREQINSLSPAEKAELLDTVWESLEADAVSLTDAQRAELDYRIARHEQNPSDVIPWQQVRAGLFKKP